MATTDVTEGLDLDNVRARFPALSRTIYLDTASGAPLSIDAAEAAKAYYDEAAASGDVLYREWLERVEETRRIVARAVGGRPERVAFVANASHGLALVERLVSDGAERTGLIAPEGDFPSITYPWLNRGRPVHLLPPDPAGQPDYAGLPDGVLKEAGTLAVGHVHYRTGTRVDLHAARRFADRHGLRLVVDATQSVGVLGIDADAVGADAVTFSVYKWPAAGYGVGVLYLREGLCEDGELPLVGWRSAADPYALVTGSLERAAGPIALEGGHVPFAPIFALGAALSLIERIGRERVEARVLGLAAMLREALRARGERVFAGGGSGIVSFVRPDAEEVKARLAAQGIAVAARGGAVRVSVSYYNTEDEIAAFLAAL